MSEPVPACSRCVALEAEVSALRALVVQQQALIESLQAQVQELTARLNQHSGNSSRPPSADPPAAPPRPQPPRSGRRPGGQPGHPGHSRRLPEPDRIVPCPPHDCRHCGHSLDGVTPEPQRCRRHTVIEIPPVRPEVTEYQCSACTCPACGTRTWGELPPGVPTGGFGPRLQALAATLTGVYRVSRRAAVEWLGDWCGVPLSLGTLSRLEQRTAAALEGAYREAGAATAQAAAVNVDETSWKEKRKRPWLWLAATQQVAYFRIADGRTRAAFQELLPLERGPDLPPRRVMSDRFSSYSHLEPWQRGLCWAHLKRDFQGRFDAGGPGRTVAHWALDEIAKLFAHWHAFRRGECDRVGLQERLAPVQEAFRALLRMGTTCGCAKTEALCQNLLTVWDGLWTFGREAGIEPTNNHAERCLRRGVLWRKTSFGTQSAGGRQFVERMLTVTTTLRLQGRSISDYLEAACRAALDGTPPPSLLPAPTP
ncbi:MAG TPA: IS66 family transposase [Longimicrobium sp.]|nr:IS66 family transposase [Longimicrobium sp.]